MCLKSSILATNSIESANNLVESEILKEKYETFIPKSYVVVSGMLKIVDEEVDLYLNEVLRENGEKNIECRASQNNKPRNIQTNHIM